MLFNSVIFLIFFLIVYGLYHFSGVKNRKWILLFSSFVFYATWDVLTFNSLIPRFFFHFLGVLTVNYFFVYKLERSTDPVWRKRYVITAVLINLLNLGFFKYLYFFTDILGGVFGHSEWRADLQSRIQIILPIAISFYTFQTIAFVVDKYRNEIEEHTSYTDFVLFIFFFPQQLAGPILKAKEFLPRLKNPIPVTKESIYLGLAYVGVGILKKGVMADTLADIVNPVFQNPGNYSAHACFAAAMGFLIQLYGDFSGYSDMAIGCGKLLGFDLPQNFHAPFFSKNFSEMWERWHITLSRFLREYIYFPLGGSKLGTFRANVNSFVTMLIAGLWHGANWNYLLWGVVIGGSLILERTFLNHFVFWKNKPETRFAKLSRNLVIFLFWILLALIFRVAYLEDIGTFLVRIFSFASGKQINTESIYYLTILCFGLQYLEDKPGRYETVFLKKPIPVFVFGSILLLVYLSDLANKQVQFIYFQF